jgi:hypothetical protein
MRRAHSSFKPPSQYAPDEPSMPDLTDDDLAAIAKLLRDTITADRRR